MSNNWKSDLFNSDDFYAPKLTAGISDNDFKKESASMNKPSFLGSIDDIIPSQITPSSGVRSTLSNSSSNIYFDIDDSFSEGISKTANMGGTASATGGTSFSSAVDFYSPWLSSDYLELPRSYAEERRWYRFFYDQDPLVGRAIDLKTFIPLSKMTLGLPRSSSHVQAQKIHSYFEQTWNRLRMFEKVMWILHEYNLIGEVLIYFEWDDEEKIWSKILILDPDTCEVRYMPYADETRVFLRPDTSIKEVIEDLKDKDRYSTLAGTLETISEDALADNDNVAIELNTDPRQGSFVKYFGRKRSPYRPGPGVSILRRLMRTLLFRDKIRQALTQITSRHMTPVRIVWAENLSYEELNMLRDQVDLAIMGPDFSIVTNYQVNWEEITAESRLFDATSIFERTTEELLIGLGMTKELLIGEGSYGAGRITLQVLDTEYSLVRELLQEMFNEVFRVAAEKNEFFEMDQTTGYKYSVFSTLKFSRMSLRDYSDVFDFFWNLYTNGSLDKETLLDFMNIDAVDVESKLKNNFLTINDNLADELRRSIYSGAAERLMEETDIMDRLKNGFGLKGTLEDSDVEIPEKEEAGLATGFESGEEAPAEEGAMEEGETPAETSSPFLPTSEPTEKKAPELTPKKPSKPTNLKGISLSQSPAGSSGPVRQKSPETAPSRATNLKGISLSQSPAGASGPVRRKSDSFVKPSSSSIKLPEAPTGSSGPIIS